MNQEQQRKRIWLQVLSYILVAAAASVLTFALFCRTNKLTQLQQIISQRFIGEVNTVTMEDAAAKAMVASLGDRWSYYVSAEEYASYEEGKTNSYVGIGITIAQRSDGTGFDIISVAPNGPAQQAGVLPGDILVAADGQSVAGMDTTGPSDLIKGEVGTEVTITILRGGEELHFTMKREKVETAVATGKMLEGNIGYVKIVNFNDNCADHTLAVVEDLLEQGAEKLIFDVRFNRGGYVHEMVEVLDYLLPEGDLFRSVDYNGNERVDTSDAACLEIPMAVLINGESYSAAEFFAAALREYEWAVVVGQQTCGKSYFQNTFQLQDGSAVGLSVGQYFTPNGVSLAQEGGLRPDVEIPVEDAVAQMIYAEVLETEEDPQLMAAIQALKE